MDATPSRTKRLVVCLDGTWNNAAKGAERTDGTRVYKPSNVLKTARAVRDLDQVVATLVLEAPPQDGETLQLGDLVYTFRSRPRKKLREVAIHKDAARCVRNLADAIGKNANGASAHPEIAPRRVPREPRMLELVLRSPGIPVPYRVTSSLSTGRFLIKESIAGIAGTLRDRQLSLWPGISQIAYYDLGVGALRAFPGLSNKLHRVVDRIFGGAAGAGFEGNVEDAYLFLCLNYRTGDEIFIFGFSRGAASARSLARFIDWMGGLLPPDASYWAPTYFDAFLAGGESQEVQGGIFRRLFNKEAKKLEDKQLDETTLDQKLRKASEVAQKKTGTILPVRIRFLGAWDTVLSLQSERRERPHQGEFPPSIVDHARQALALDERRSDFAPWIWTGISPTAPSRQTLEQRWFCGAHSNVGGSYPNDGLANIPLRWMLKEATAAGLGLDWDFLEPYQPFHRDTLYDSSRGAWKVRQWLRPNAGVREVFVSDWLKLDPSIFKRLKWKPDSRKHPQLELYRPPNLLRFLAQHDDQQLEQLLRSVPGLSADYRLPTDVLETIEKLRRKSR